MRDRLLCWTGSATALALAVHLLPHHRSYDAQRYLAMAFGNPSEPLVPYGRRLLTPWLASFFRSPHFGPEVFAVHFGFKVITVLALDTAALLFKTECEKLGLEPRHRFFALALLFTLLEPVLYLLEDPWMVDPLLLMFWIGGTVTILARKDWLLCGTIAVGAVNKEVTILLGAVWFLFHVERDSLARTAIRAALITLPGIAVLTVIALTHPAPAGQTSEALASAWDVISPRSVIRGMVTAGLPLLVVLPWGQLARDSKRLLIAGAATVLPLTLIATDTGRMLGLAAPFWIPAVAPVLSGWQVALIAAGDVLVGLSVTKPHDRWLRPFGLASVAIAIAASIIPLLLAPRPTVIRPRSRNRHAA